MNEELGKGVRDEPGTVLALVADLFFASRIRGAGRAAGVEVRTVSKGSELIEAAGEARPRLILIDLAVRGTDPAVVIGDLKRNERTAGVQVIAFGAHVDRDALLAARQAGADQVLARSAFVRQLATLLGGTDVSPPERE